MVWSGSVCEANRLIAAALVGHAAGCVQGGGVDAHACLGDDNARAESAILGDRLAKRLVLRHKVLAVAALRRQWARWLNKGDGGLSVWLVQPRAWECRAGLRARATHPHQGA